MRKLIVIFSLFAVSLTYAQVTNLPSINSLKGYNDLRKVEPTVIKTIDWLTKNESFKNSTREKSIQFVNDFVSKSDYLVYNPSKSIAKFRKNSEYNLQFKLGWIKFALEYEYSKNTKLNHYQAITYVLDFYDKNKSVTGRSSYLEKLKKLKQNKQLKEFINSKI